MQQRRAIITFDPARIAAADLQAEAHNIAWIVRQALLGRDYPRERGILSIDLIGEDAAQKLPGADIVS